MPALSLGLSSYERSEGDLPPLPLKNMYAEQTQSEDVVLQSRRGLQDRFKNMGAGPVEALYKRNGVLSGGLIGVSGGKLYAAPGEVGAIAGSGFVSIAGNETGALIAAGSSLYSYDGTTLATVSLPDDFNCIKILEGSSRFIAIRGGSAKWYFTPPLAQTFDPLDFATAEAESDELLDALFIDDILILFGAETVEFWPNTGDQNLPFQPLQGRVFERGIRATGCATALGSTFAWVTNENTVCVQDENNVVSNPGIQERLAASANVRAFNFFIDGTEFLAVRMDGETQVFNPRTGTWSEFSTVDQDNWVAQCHAGGVFGSAIDGKTLQWGAGYQELGGELERRFGGGFPINGSGVSINRLSLRCNPGQTPFVAGAYANPSIEVRTSRDAGQTWSNWLPQSLGAQGNYRERVEWRALGYASQPGFLAQWRLTDPVPLRTSGAFIQEPFGGR